MNLANRMTTLGHLASKPQLAALGHGRHVVDTALAQGLLVPVRPGWVASTRAEQLAVIAVLQGARLTSASALRRFEVWNGVDRDIHLQLPANAHRVRQMPLTPIAQFRPPPFSPARVVRHWADVPETSQSSPQWTVGVFDALVAFCRRQADDQVVAAVESAVHVRALSRRDLPHLSAALPRRLRRLFAKLNFKAESGLESIARWRLTGLGLNVAVQVDIGPDRVDLVIDGWLIVELDGDAWHDPVTDRIRTNRLIRAGYAVLRFGSADVLSGWDDMLATIAAMLGDASRRRA